MPPLLLTVFNMSFMKKSNLFLAFSLLFLGSMLTSCSSGRGCKGGGWYGDRNLTNVTPAAETPEQSFEFYSEATCAD